MSQLPLARSASQQPRPWIWIGAILATGAVAAWGVWLNATTTLEMLLRGEVAARTIWGVLALAAGFLGPLIPVLLALNRRRFLRLPQAGQWVALVAIPGIHFLLLVRLITAAEHSSTAVVPLLYPYTAIIEVKPTDVTCFVPLTGSPAVSCSGSASGAGNGNTPFTRTFTVGKQTIFKLTGTRTQPAWDLVEIAGELELQERFRLRIHGLKDVQVTRDNETVSESAEFKPGKYGIVIRGHPTSSLVEHPFGHGGYNWVLDKDRPKPGPVPGIDHASVHVGHWGKGMAYVVWTDIYQAGASGGGAGGSDNPAGAIRFSGYYQTGAKDVFAHDCVTYDGKTGIIAVDGQKFDLAAGSLILAATADGKIRLKQLKRDTLHMQPDTETFKNLAKTDPEIRAFFSPVITPEASK